MKGRVNSHTVENLSCSAVAGDSSLSGEDQLVDINGGIMKEDLHCRHLLNFTIVYYSNILLVCKEVFVKKLKQFVEAVQRKMLAFSRLLCYNIEGNAGVVQWQNVSFPS